MGFDQHAGMLAQMARTRKMQSDADDGEWIGLMKTKESNVSRTTCCSLNSIRTMSAIRRSDAKVEGSLGSPSSLARMPVT